MDIDSSYPPSAETWRRFVDQRRKALMERRLKLESATNECLQLEASLTQIEGENVAATRELREREIALRQSRAALEQRRRQREQSLSALDKDSQKTESERRLEERKIGNACAALEAERRETASQHAAVMDTLATQLQTLQEAEQNALERLYRLADVELELAARARRVQSCRDSTQKALNDTVAQLEREMEQLKKLSSPNPAAN